MDFIVLQHLRSRSGHGVREKEVAADGKTGGRDLDDLAAVHLTDDALDEHLLARVAVAHEGGVHLQQIGEAVGAEAHTALIRDIGVAQLLLRVQEQLVGVLLRRLSVVVVAEGRSLGGKSTENVGVELRHAHLVELTRKGLARIRHHLGHDLVALVDDEGEGTVAGQRHALNVAGQIVGRAVTRGAGLGVVGHNGHGDAVDLDGLHTGELVVVVQSEHSLRLTSESLVNVRGISGCKVNTSRHGIISPLIK